MRLTTLNVVAMFAGALLAPAGWVSSKAGGESKQAGRLLTEIKADAEQIRSCARNLENLAKTPGAKWQEYDQQWNTIKPAQERIDLATQRLESMQASLAPAEQKVLAQTKRDLEEISSTTHDLWIRLGQPKLDLQALSADARGLDKAARELVNVTASTS
jgi:hypothetical protein